MKQLFARVFLSFFWMHGLLAGYSLELNTCYDYFRGMPDGSWNGNNGALIGGNAGLCLFDYANLQAGGSYGLYNWDGRNNLVFSNPKIVEQIGFITVGISSSLCGWSAGLVYDRMISEHFGIYDVSLNLDQLRFQVGYSFCSEEFGVWGTGNISNRQKDTVRSAHSLQNDWSAEFLLEPFFPKLCANYPLGRYSLSKQSHVS